MPDLPKVGDTVFYRAPDSENPNKREWLPAVVTHRDQAAETLDLVVLSAQRKNYVTANSYQYQPILSALACYYGIQLGNWQHNNPNDQNEAV